MFVCFFKQKTAYEMRISDWSSDVCSSDLVPCRAVFLDHEFRALAVAEFSWSGDDLHDAAVDHKAHVRGDVRPEPHPNPRGPGRNIDAVGQLLAPTGQHILIINPRIADAFPCARTCAAAAIVRNWLLDHHARTPPCRRQRWMAHQTLRNL